jgi:hypothetical protein
MPPAFVQSEGGTSNTLSSLPIAFTSNNTAGNLLVCSGVVNASTIGGLTITDTQGNTWTIALVDTWNSVSTFFMAYAPNCKVGANTVTIAQLGSLISGAVSEYSGVFAVAPLDKTGFSDSGAGTWTSATSGNVTTNENGELIVAAQGNSTGPASVTLGSGFSNLQNDSGNVVSIESQVQATAGAIAGTFTISASSGACGVLTFVPPADALPFNVWSPQGNVLPNSLAGGASLGNPNVLYDTNPVVLTGNTHVFKMWCMSGTANPFGVSYFESVDGLTSWTAYSGNPLVTNTQGTLPKIYKNGSTYYLYIGNGTIAAYTSTDGVTFTLQNATAIAPSASNWDNFQCFQLQVIDIIGGTWYGYYSANASPAVPATDYSMGLATSTDGIHWTKVGTTPVINARTSNFTFQKVGNIYYGWSQGKYNNTNSAQFNPALGGTSALSHIFRFSSPSVTGPWTQLISGGNNVSTYHPTIAADFAGTVGGTNQIGDPSLITANGNCYLYYDTTSSGTNIRTNAAVAIGVSLAQLVAGYEGVVGAPISGAPQLNLVTQGSDTFQRANANPIGGNWSALGTFGQLQLTSDLVEGITTSTGGADYWNAFSWPNGHWSTVTANAGNAGSNLVAVTRSNNSGAINCYNGVFFVGAGGLGTSGSVEIQKRIAGVNTTLLTFTGLILSQGDTLMTVANGTNILVYFNGIVFAGLVDSSVASGTGGAGMFIFPNGAVSVASLSAWSGGTFQDAPALQASISGNTGVGGATVSYSGASSGSVVADSFGNYILPNLVNGSYTITPSLAGYTFSPTNASETLNGTNITGVNFTATKVKGSGGEQRFGFGFNFKF